MCQPFEELLSCRREVKRLGEKSVACEAEILRLKEEYEQPPKPEIKLLSMTGAQARKEVLGKGLRLMYPTMMDGPAGYFYTNDEGWAEVFEYIYTRFNMPTYIAGRMDCEDFAIWLKGLVSVLFGLNYFALTVGQIPGGCHGFNFFRTEDRLLIVEPQRAEFFEWGERDYKPEWALI